MGTETEIETGTERHGGCRGVWTGCHVWRRRQMTVADDCSLYVCEVNTEQQWSGREGRSRRARLGFPLEDYLVCLSCCRLVKSQRVC